MRLIISLVLAEGTNKKSNDTDRGRAVDPADLRILGKPCTPSPRTCYYGFVLDVLLTTEVLVGLSVFSVICFVGSLIAIPFILVRLPANYFDERYPRSWLRNHHPVLRVLAHVVKNLGGAVFVLAGIAMLVLPGQGILTILIGVSFLDFPGKRRLEAMLIGQPLVLNAINGMREKFGRSPLVLSPERDKNTVCAEAQRRK